METTTCETKSDSVTSTAAPAELENQGQGDPEVTSCGVLEEEARTPRPVRRKIRIRGERICAVCGDRANSHNFGALTCDTCKAFFRRNANKRRKIPDCVFANNCVVDKATRRFCSACRLKKCLAVGMTPDLIISNREENEKRTAKLSVTRASPSTKEKSDSDSVVPGDETPRRTPEYKDASILENLYAESIRTAHAADGVSSASSGPTTEEEEVPPSLEPQAQEQTISDAILELFAAGSDISTLASLYGLESSVGEGSSTLCAPSSSRPLAADSASTSPDKVRSRGRDFKHVAREELPWDMQMYWPLTGEERALLTQLTSVFQTSLVDSLEEQVPSSQAVESGCLTTETMVKILEMSMYKNVSFAKTVPEFRQLRQADQISLLKASAMQMYSVRCASCYLPEEKVWVGTHGHVSAIDVMRVFDYEVGVHDFIDFCTSLKCVVKNNITIYALMHCIILFDPRGATIEDRVQVNAFRDKYVILLKHYLESEYSFSFADLYMAEIMESLYDVRVLGENLQTFYRQYSSLFLPLVAECMSL